MADPLSIRLDEIARKLDRLDALDRARFAFGAGPIGKFGHKYRRDPPLRPQDLAEVERRLGVELPDEMRAFVTRLHSAGAGPNYGLLSPSTAEGTGGPFPFSRQQGEEILARRKIEAHRYEFLELPEDDESDPLRGCVALADAGCGWYDAIVLSGELRGTIWTIGEGFAPHGGRMHGFFDWYEQWLDRWLEPAAIATPLAELSRIPKDARGLHVTDEPSPAMPPEIMALTEIETLLFVRAKLAVVPGWIASFRKLRTLGLDNNALDSLPEELFAMPHLEKLSLSGNAFRALPERIGGLRALRQLLVVGNQLRSVPAALTTLPLLERIDLRFNPIPPAQIDALKAARPDLQVDVE